MISVAIVEPHQVRCDLRQALLGGVEIERDRGQLVDLGDRPRVAPQVDLDQVAAGSSRSLDPQVREDGLVGAVAVATADTGPPHRSA